MRETAPDAAQTDAPALIDVLDRVLDKGILISCDVDVCIAGSRTVGITEDVVAATTDAHRRTADAAVVEAQRSAALSDAVDEYLRRLDHAA